MCRSKIIQCKVRKSHQSIGESHWEGVPQILGRAGRKGPAERSSRIRRARDDALTGECRGGANLPSQSWRT